MVQNFLRESLLLLQRIKLAPKLDDFAGAPKAPMISLGRKAPQPP